MRGILWVVCILVIEDTLNRQCRTRDGCKGPDVKCILFHLVCVVVCGQLIQNRKHPVS
jgi:hypothetical protein